MYKSDITTAQFELVHHLFPVVKRTKPRKYTDHELFNGILYVLESGSQWRLIPHDYPKWRSAYKLFRTLVMTKVFYEMLYVLNNQYTADLEFRSYVPTLWWVTATDSQSVQSTDLLKKEHKGYDGNKKISGIKRFVLCDVLGRVWAVHTTHANTGERQGLLEMLSKCVHFTKFPKAFRVVLADKGFSGTQFEYEVRKHTGLQLKAMKPIKHFKKLDTNPSSNSNSHTSTYIKLQTEIQAEHKSISQWLNFCISKTRSVVERVFSWLDKRRRLLVCHEKTHSSHQGFMLLAMIRLMMKRLKPGVVQWC